MAMVDLAHQETATHAAELVSLADIASRQQLSQSYLEQLFGKLRRADLVCAARGPGGGYRLARPAADIAISDIVTAVDEPIKATRCEVGSGGCLAAPTPTIAGPTIAGPTIAGPTSRGEMCQTHDLWFELGRQITLFLRGITLADVALGRVAGRAIGSASSQPPETDEGPP